MAIKMESGVKMQTRKMFLALAKRTKITPMNRKGLVNDSLEQLGFGPAPITKKQK